jgi:hypothetical protein
MLILSEKTNLRLLGVRLSAFRLTQRRQASKQPFPNPSSVAS